MNKLFIYALIFAFVLYVARARTESMASSPGSLLQLQATGPMDSYLTEAPRYRYNPHYLRDTFYRPHFYRH